jgi:hypothetical protein
MTMEHMGFPNGHGQNDHFDHDHSTVKIIKWSESTKVSTNFKEFGIVEMVLVKFGLNILAIGGP